MKIYEIDLDSDSQLREFGNSFHFVIRRKVRWMEEERNGEESGERKQASSVGLCSWWCVGTDGQYVSIIRRHTQWLERAGN